VDASQTDAATYYVVGMRRSLALPLLALIVALATSLPSSRALAQSSAGRRTSELDRDTLVALENDWLAHLCDSATLERILAPDFEHAVEPGRVLITLPPVPKL
jgi:hypothetical protein